VTNTVCIFPRGERRGNHTKPNQYSFIEENFFALS
jgi:hypothetical protein